MAANYNSNTYNSALYNAGRDEASAVAKSIIQAHTGPHIQTALGFQSKLFSDSFDISFISDFNIVEGSVRKPPQFFIFPDLKARIKSVKSGQDDLNSLVVGFAIDDLLGKIFPTNKIPELNGIIFGLLENNLSGIILGRLAEANLSARLQIVQENLAGIILGLDAPNLSASILSIKAPDLGAIIWAPADLKAFITTVQAKNLSGNIFSFQSKDLSGSVFSFDAPKLSALIKGLDTANQDVNASLFAIQDSVLQALIVSSIPGPNDVLGNISSSGDFIELKSFLRSFSSNQKSLKATIGRSFNNKFDLSAKLDFFSALNLKANLTTLELGSNDKFLNAFLQSVNTKTLLAQISSNQNLNNLKAQITSTFGHQDLNAFLRAAETFITAVLTINTFSASDLRATIGNPSCSGGSAIKSLAALAIAQQAATLTAQIQSFIETDLKASINSNNTFLATDTINVKFTASIPRPKSFFVTDTISVHFSPFRGANLSATIQSVLSNMNLSATLNAVFPLQRVESFVDRLTAADLRPLRDLNIQELRLQMEGELLNFIYVNGTEDVFIENSDETWQINVRSFRELGDQLFGEFATARVCRLGNISRFNTFDEAMRACISAVLGQDGEQDLFASLNARGSLLSLPANLSISDVFSDFSAKIDRVFPSNLSASVFPIVLGINKLNANIIPTVSSNLGIPASITGFGQSDLNSLITANNP